MTKSELKALPVEELRALMSEHFDGITEDTTKKELLQLVADNWDDFLDLALNPVDMDPVTPAELLVPSPSTDLYSGRMPH